MEDTNIVDLDGLTNIERTILYDFQLLDEVEQRQVLKNIAEMIAANHAAQLVARNKPITNERVGKKGE